MAPESIDWNTHVFTLKAMESRLDGEILAKHTLAVRNEALVRLIDDHEQNIFDLKKIVASLEEEIAYLKSSNKAWQRASEVWEAAYNRFRDDQESSFHTLVDDMLPED